MQGGFQLHSLCHNILPEGGTQSPAAEKRGTRHHHGGDNKQQKWFQGQTISIFKFKRKQRKCPGWIKGCPRFRAEEITGT
ncbi:hypothetical protein EK904_001617 [Melospiza melodia maxima]|nr:hypothetical protein EK904_001617 [Melospiza melodia maxima]